MPDFIHPTNRSVVSLESPTPDKVQRLLDAGYTPREVTTDVAPGGQLRQRTADPSNTEYDPLRHEASAEENEALRQTAYDEGISRDAQSFGVQALVGGSTLLSDMTLGASTALGFDARALLPEHERALVREQTQGVEMGAHVLGAISPMGAEAVITRGASWIGSPVARLATEGAAGGAFNAIQEAAIARDPDVFAERFLGDMGIGALLGAGLGAPLSAASGLSRMVRGTSAARANSQFLDAASDIADGPMDIARMARLADEALNPQRFGGRLQEAFGGAAAPRGRGQDFRAFEREIRRHRGRSPEELDLASDGVARDLAELQRAQGLLADVSPNAVLPTRGLDDAAVPQMRSRLAGVRRDLDAIDVPGGRAGPVGSALNSISRALDVAEGATPQEALRHLYNAPAAIDRAVAGLSDLERNALNGAVSFRGAAEGTSDLLNGGGLRELTDSLDGLMSDSLFGEAGALMSSRRAAQRRVGEALNGIRQNFEQTAEGGVLDHAAFRRIVKEASASGDVESLQRLADARALVGDLQGQGQLFPELAGLRQGAPVGSQQLDEFMAGAYATAQARRISDAEQEASKGVQQGLRQGLGGLGLAGAALAAGPVGVIGGLGVAGLALAARSPFSMQRMVARVRNAFDSQGARLGRSLDNTTQIAHSTSRTPFLQRLSPRAGSLAAFTLNGSAEEKGKLYEEIVTRVQEMQENPLAMVEALTPQTEVIGDVVPGLNTAAGMQGHRQLSALAAALPLSARTQSAIARLSGPVPLPSATAINEFLQVAAVVEDPIFGVDLMNAGRLTRGSAAALATSFPNFHEEVTARIISDIARAAQRRTRRRRGGTSGPRMNYQAALMMSRFVGFPLDSTMEPGFQSAVNSQSAQTSQQDAAQFSRPVSVREPSFLQTEETPMGRIGN